MSSQPFASFGLASLLVAVACGTEPPAPGAVTITLDDVPALTTTTGLIVTGHVARSPEVPDMPIVVSLTQGTTVATDTAAAEGTFRFGLTLTANQSTTLTISATDASGSTSAPVSAEVRHDGVPPGVVTLTPGDLADDVTPTLIQALFGEPIVPGTATIALSHQRIPVPGALALSVDSLTLSFTPTAALFGNAIYNVVVSGARDVAGNTAGNSAACFVTGAAQATFADPTSDFFTAVTPPANLVPIDLIGLRLRQTGDHLYGIVRFTTPRSFDVTSPSNTLIIVDLDVDSDGTTGFTTAKDTAFGAVLPNSGTKAEYGIWLLPQASPGDSSAVVQYTQPLGGTITQRIMPNTCGQAVSFMVARSALGNDDGTFRTVLYSDTFFEEGGYADPGPDAGFYAANLPTASATAASAFTVAPLDRVNLRQWRPRIDVLHPRPR
ncbi:MAG: Ig-like domain-containing protein [Gemmatimonadales bacterium]